MKRSFSKSGFSVFGVVAAVLALAVLVGLAAWSLMDKKANEVNYSNYDFNNIISGNEDNGGIGDHVKGDKNAPVVIVEYADFQCPGCASVNPRVNKLVEEYDGKLAVVYRNYLLSYHQNGTAAASAAEAAGLQGYWKEYADMLFANQSNWEDIEADEREATFSSLFEAVSNGQGDIDKFKADMKSKEVSKKISFDMGIGKKVDLPGTPAFYLDGEYIDLSGGKTEEDFYNTMRKKIDAKLKAQK